MTKEKRKEIESYLIDGGYSKQLKDIWFAQDFDYNKYDEDDLEAQEVEPIEFEELY